MDASRWLLGAILGAMLAVSGSASALDISVNTTSDLVDANPGDGQCQTASNSCSLRAAVMEANAWVADVADNITVPAGIYYLSLDGADEDAALGDLDINAYITISGAGAGQTIIDGNNTDRIFDVYSAGNLTLDGVTLQNGELIDTGWSGGGTSGPVSVLESINGGAIRVQGNLIARNSVITASSVQGDGGGLHIMFGSATLENTEVSNNGALGFGAGIFVQEGELRIADSLVQNNYLPSFPGTIVGGGLAIFNASVQIEGSTFAGNRAFRDGGAIYYALGDMNIINSTFSGNVATRFGGAIYVSGGSNSSAFNWFQSINLSNVTIAYNQAAAVDNEQSILHPGAGGVYLNYLGSVTMSNTLVADNVGGDCFVDAGGEVVSLGYNLDGDGSCALTAAGDISNVGSGNLMPLLDNGGPTPTHALDVASPAINSANDEVCLDNGLVDQRGYVRPAVGCDIGAFELEGDSGVAPPPPPPEEPADNLAPVAMNMVVSVKGGASYVGVLNGSDPNGDELSFQIIGQGGYVNDSGFGMGVLIHDDTAPAGSFIYRTDVENPVDADMFTYRACDPWGLCSNTAQVQVLIDQTAQAANLPTLEVVQGTGSNVDGVTVLSSNFLEAVTGGIDYTYPVGGLVFSVTDIPTDGVGANQATVTLQFPVEAEITADAVVRKMDVAGNWHTLPNTQPLDPVSGDPLVATWAEVDVVSRSITLHLVDNDEFDHNPTIGVIDDPVTLAEPARSIEKENAGGAAPPIVVEAASEAVTVDDGGAGGLGWFVLGLGLSGLLLRRKVLH